MTVHTVLRCSALHEMPISIPDELSSNPEMAALWFERYRVVVFLCSCELCPHPYRLLQRDAIVGICL